MNTIAERASGMILRKRGFLGGVFPLNGGERSENEGVKNQGVKKFRKVQKLRVGGVLGVFHLSKNTVFFMGVEKC